MEKEQFLPAERVDTPPWLLENQDFIKCLSLNASEALFSAWMAANTYEPTGVTWWSFAYEAILSTAQLFACSAPPESVFIEAFEGDNKRCQCAEIAGELFFEYLDPVGDKIQISYSQPTQAKKIVSAVLNESIATCTWETVNGVQQTSTADLGAAGTRPIWYIVPTLDTGCCKGTPEIPPVQPLPNPWVLPGADPACEITVNLIDSCIDKFGLSQNYYRVEGNGYCDLIYGDKFWYWESIRGPIVYSDFNSGNECFGAIPSYAPPHPHAAPDVPAGSSGVSGLDAVGYILDVGCTYDPETDDFKEKYQFEVEANTDGILGLARRMDALALMINNAQLIPYTVCNDKPPLEGEFRTIGFISEKTSPYGKSRLRKRFRYRSVSGVGLDGLVDHWKDFEFDSGPVIVQHRGASWGTVKCWASSADEGKRVIRHAAGEAGLNPDQVGRWEISGSNSPRLGVSDTMKVNMTGGYYWITARDGSDNRPLVGKT